MKLKEAREPPLLNAPGADWLMQVRPQWIEGMYGKLRRCANLGEWSNLAKAAGNMRRAGFDVDGYCMPYADKIRESVRANEAHKSWWFLLLAADEATMAGVAVTDIVLDYEREIGEYLRRERPRADNDNFMNAACWARRSGLDVSAEVREKEGNLREILRCHSDSEDWWAFARDAERMSQMGLDVSGEVSPHSRELLEAVGRYTDIKPGEKGDYMAAWDLVRYASSIKTLELEPLERMRPAVPALYMWFEGMAKNGGWIFMAEQLASLREVGLIATGDRARNEEIPPIRRVGPRHK